MTAPMVSTQPFDEPGVFTIRLVPSVPATRD